MGDGLKTGFGMGIGFVVAVITIPTVTCVGGLFGLANLGAARRAAVELRERQDQREADRQGTVTVIDRAPATPPRPAPPPDEQSLVKTRLPGETLDYGYRSQGWGPTDPPEEVLPGVVLRGVRFEREMQHFSTRVRWWATFENSGEQRRVNVRVVAGGGGERWVPAEHVLGGVVGVLNRGVTAVRGEFTVPQYDEARVQDFALEVFRE